VAIPTAILVAPSARRCMPVSSDAVPSRLTTAVQRNIGVWYVALCRPLPGVVVTYFVTDSGTPSPFK
jgi:hypothetical protein